MRAKIFRGTITKVWFCHIMTGSVWTDEVYRCRTWEEAMERACKELGREREDDRH